MQCTIHIVFIENIPKFEDSNKTDTPVHPPPSLKSTKDRDL